MKSELFESILKEGRDFDRTSKDPTIGVFSDYFNISKLPDVLEKAFEKANLPYEINGVKYDDTTRTLKIVATMYLKAYGDGYESEDHYTAKRSSYTKNTFTFDEALSQDEAELIYPLGLVKTGTYYPASSFHYTDYNETNPRRLHYVDNIELDILKSYD